jgi:diguanylate cyclase (GGDEF)-like protein
MHLAQEVSRSRRMKTSLAVMVCDINGLKKINDSFGHLEGDKLLREFSMLLKEACRGYDYVARMGGDEFVITAPGLSHEGVEEKINRLKQAAIEAGRRTCGREVTSLSVGTAFCPEDGYDVEALLAEADRRMYSVKQAHYAKIAAGQEALAQGAAGK